MSPVVLPTPIISKASGSPEFALPGTGQTVLGGVESYYIYNDLVMNDRKNIDSYIIKEVDGLADPDVRDSREPIPQSHGENVFSSWYGGRTIVLQGMIRAHNIHKLRDMQEALKQAFNPLTEKPLRIVSPFSTAPHHDIPNEFEAPSVSINCKKSQPLQMRESQNNFKFTRDFMLTLRASNPFLYSDYKATVSLIDITSPLSFEMVNHGNYKAYPQILLTGPMTNPIIANNFNGESININGTIGATQTWVLDMSKRSFVDHAGVNKFSMLDVSSDWLTIEPGANVLTLSFSSGTAATAITVNFNHTWI